MNNTLNINRFASLLLRELNIYKMKMTWVTVASLGIFILCEVLYTLGIGSFTSFFTSVGLALTILSPLFFYKGLDKISSVIDFTLPASTLEKFLVKWSFSVLLMPIFVILNLLLVGSLFVLFPSEMSHETGHRIIDFITSESYEDILAIFAFQSFFLVGVHFFRKHVFLKVSLSLIAYFILCIIVFSIFHKELLSSGTSHSMSLSMGDSGSIIYGGNSQITSMFGGSNNRWIGIIFNLIAPFGMWVVSFFKLKETEI